MINRLWTTKRLQMLKRLAWNWLSNWALKKTVLADWACPACCPHQSGRTAVSRWTLERTTETVSRSAEWKRTIPAGWVSVSADGFGCRSKTELDPTKGRSDLRKIRWPSWPRSGRWTASSRTGPGLCSDSASSSCNRRRSACHGPSNH